MLNKSELSQLRRFVSGSVNESLCQHCHEPQSPALNRKGGVLLLEVIEYYEQTIQKERISEPETSDGHTRDAPKRGSSSGGRGSSRKRRSGVRT
jgi:hypothetical protein